MKLQTKLAWYNATTKITILVVIALLMPLVVEQVVYDHMDTRLLEKKTKLIHKLSKIGIDGLVREEGGEFESYNVLKEEYITLSLVSPKGNKDLETRFLDAERLIEGERSDYRILSHRFLYKGECYELEIGARLKEVEDLKARIWEFTFVVLLIGVLFSILLDVGFAQFLLRPFKRIIQQKMQKVQDPMKFDFTPIITSTNDFRMLDESLNQMMQQVKDTFLKEKQFIAHVSHELLTPISILKSRFENLLNSEAASEEGSRKIVASLQTLEHLRRLINDLLLLSKVDHAQYMIADEVLIGELLKEVLEDWEDQYEHQGIRLENRVQEQVLFRCNRTLLRTLFGNLLSNSLKYNRAKGKLTITEEFMNGCYILKLKDTGIGMTVEQLSKLFDRFERFGKQDEMGHGLGLAIVHSIATFHGIGVQVQSSAGEGTVFSLSFPLNSTYQH